jgi:hypothetical protein
MVEDKHLWDTFESKPPSSIEPRADVKPEIKFQSINKDIEILWKEKDKNLYYQYKKGIMTAQKINTKEISVDRMLVLCIDNVIQGIRDNIEDTTDNIEEKHTKLNQLSTISNVMKESVLVLKSMNFKLDNSLILPIMHGYITECAYKTLK